LSRATILNDNGRPRPPGTNYTVLNVTATDNVGISNVTVDLTPLNQSGAQPLTRIGGTDIWTVTIKAPYEAGVNLTNPLVVNVTDEAGNFNTSTVYLTVLRRGDVVRDNVIDEADGFYIYQYVLGIVPEPDKLVSDVVPAEGDGVIDERDGFYIYQYALGTEIVPEP